MTDERRNDIADERVLSLFSDAGSVPTPTPDVRAWVARDSVDGRLVLIKRIAEAPGSKARATESLSLIHPGITRARRWLREQGFLYVVRDVVRGRNLRASLGTPGSASPEAMRRLLLPAIEAMEYAHRRGVAHGGISLENILISENGTVVISDWSTADSRAPQHFLHYQGTASIAGDVRALSRIVSEYLPAGGPFAAAAVRDRIRGILNRCDTLADLTETVTALERLAAAPLPRERTPVAPTPPVAPAAEEDDTAVSHWQATAATGPQPRLVSLLAEKSARVSQGSGGTVTLIVRNEGTAELVIRMVATQHPWLNVQPVELPITIAPGRNANIPFAISAARLTPGDYRSEVYLSANAIGKNAENQQEGWFRHTAEVRVTVDPTAAPRDTGGVASPVKTPSRNAPAPPGSGCLLALPLRIVAALCRRPGGCLE